MPKNSNTGNAYNPTKASLTAKMNNKIILVKNTARNTHAIMKINEFMTSKCDLGYISIKCLYLKFIYSTIMMGSALDM